MYDPAVTALDVPTWGTVYHQSSQTKKVTGTVENLGTNVDTFTVTLRVDYTFDMSATWTGLPGDTVYNGVFCYSSCSGGFYSELTYTELGSGGIQPNEAIPLSRNLTIGCPAPGFTLLLSFYVTLSASSSSGLDGIPANSSMSANRGVLCTDPTPTYTPTPTATRTPTATITPTPDVSDIPTPKPPDGDTDGDTVPNGVDLDDDNDGCPDAKELQNTIGSEFSGGRRNPHNPSDYFNPTGDGQNRIDDILAVRDQYFMDDNDGSPGLPPYDTDYNPATDRTRAGPNDWNLGPPDGLQRIDDIVNIVHQYYHDCL
jgi:hypothetical protein